MINKFLTINIILVNTLLMQVNQIKPKNEDSWRAYSDTIVQEIYVSTDIAVNEGFGWGENQIFGAGKPFFSYGGNTPISFPSFDQFRKIYSKFKFSAGSYLEFSSNEDGNKENEYQRKYSFVDDYDSWNIFPAEKLTDEQRRWKDSSPEKGRDWIKIHYKHETGFWFWSTKIEATAYFSMWYDDSRKSLFYIYRADVTSQKNPFKLFLRIKIPSIIFLHKDYLMNI